MSDLEVRVIFLEQTVARMAKVLFNADYEQICKDVLEKIEEENK